jgi:lipopolysaccharide export system ATP-binding protein
VVEIQDVIAHLKQRGIGVLISDHNVRETLAICDRAYILSEGQLLSEGTPAELLADQRVRIAYLGEHFRL